MEGGGGATRGGNSRRMKPAPLKISRESRMIRKPPPVPIPVAQQRQPVIIHTYSPKVIETDANNFMWLVQRLTGCSDTILRCKSNKPAKLRRGEGGLKRGKFPGLKEEMEIGEQEEEEKNRIKMVIQQSNLESSTTTSEEDLDTEVASAEESLIHPAVFKVEQLLLSPSSSSDSGLCFNAPQHHHHRLCVPLVASPKSPLVSFDPSAFQFLHGDGNPFHPPPPPPLPPHPFATSSALASNSDAINSFSWSPTLTPNELMSDFPLVDLWAPAAEIQSAGHSPYSRLFGSIQSPASLAYKDMASAFLKDVSSNTSCSELAG